MKELDLTRVGLIRELLNGALEAKAGSGIESVRGLAGLEKRGWYIMG